MSSEKGTGGYRPGDPETWARGLVSSLFDVQFDTFLTRRIAWLVYVLGLVAIGLSAVVRFVSALVALFVPTSPAAVIWAFLTAFVAVPIATALAVLVLRVLVELAVALVTLAENAQRSSPSASGVSAPPMPSPAAPSAPAPASSSTDGP